MKDTIRLSALGLAVAGIMATACLMSPGTKEIPATLSSEEISWVAFCKARGYDTNDNSEEVINEFLDTWVGSVEEEHAFNNLPAQEV